MSEIVIPELEEAAARYTPKLRWSKKDLAVLKKYYGRVPKSKLAGYLHRTQTSIDQQAARLGLLQKKEEA